MTETMGSEAMMNANITQERMTLEDNLRELHPDVFRHQINFYRLNLGPEAADLDNAGIIELVARKNAEGSLN